MNSPELMPEGKFLGQWPWEGKGVSSAQHKGVFMGSQDKQSFTGNISLGGWSHRKQKWGKREGGGKGREANIRESYWSDYSLWQTDCSVWREIFRDALVAQWVKQLPTMRETWVRSLGQEDPLEKEMATRSSTLAWKIPCTEKPGMGSQRVEHDWATFPSLQRCHITDVSKFSERQGFIQQFTPPICQSCLLLGETQGRRWEVCVPSKTVKKMSMGYAHSNSEACKPCPEWALFPATAIAAAYT